MGGLEAELRQKCVDAIGRRDARAALPLAQRLVAVNAQVAEYQNLLGLAEHFAGNRHAAEKAFLSALNLNASDGGILMNLGVLYKDTKRYADAIGAFNKAVSLMGNSAHTVLFNLALCHLELHQFENAIEALKKATKENPQYLKGWKELGLAYRKLAERDRDLEAIDAALASYGRIAELDPDFPSLKAAIALTWRIKAEIDLDLGQSEEAITSCRRMDEVLGGAPGVYAVVRNGAAAPGVTVFENAKVLPGSKEWFVLDGDTLHADTMASTSPVTSPYCEAVGKTQTVYRRPDAHISIDEECFLLGGSGNYYHWLIDYLPRLAAYATHERFGEIKFLTNSDPQRFQRESLQLLGIGKDRLIEVPKALTRPQEIACKTLYAAPVLLDEMRLLPEGLHWLRTTLAAACVPAADKPAGRRLYISRSDAATRKVINEKEIVQFLTPLGFDIMVPGKMPLAKQIAAFADATVIVGAHGAGFANMVFAPPGARIVEFMGSVQFQQSFLRELAESCGHRFDRIFCQTQATPAQRQRHHDEDFNMIVPIQSLAAVLSA